MRQTLRHLLRCPQTGEQLDLVALAYGPTSIGERSVTEGVLFNGAGRAYPIEAGVPFLLDGSFAPDFLSRHRSAIAREPALARLRLESGPARSWSFSEEWKHHFQRGVSRTWGWTVEERFRQFFLETQVDRDACRGWTILDAGCGNGQLTEALSQIGATVVGIDYSSSVLGAEEARRSTSVHFVGGDLLSPPFEDATFDAIISNGVLHHTPDTARAFSRVARLVKPGGLFYLWLYRRPVPFLERVVGLPLRELARSVISRLPPAAQRRTIEEYSRARARVARAVGKPQRITLAERTVLAYDALTPRWRHVHDPIEVASWFFASGFSAPSLTHWDNPHGFGMVARRVPLADTPGVRFGTRPAAHAVTSTEVSVPLGAGHRSPH